MGGLIDCLRGEHPFPRVIANHVWLFAESQGLTSKAVHPSSLLVMVYNHKGWTQYIKEQDAKTRLLLIWQRTPAICKEPREELPAADGNLPELDPRLMRVSEWKENPDPHLVEKLLRQFKQTGGKLYKGNNYQRIEHVLNRNWDKLGWSYVTAKHTLNVLIKRGVVLRKKGKEKPQPLALNNHPKSPIAQGIINWVDENLGYRRLSTQ